MMEFEELSKFLDEIKMLKSKNEKIKMIEYQFTKFQNQNTTEFFHILRLMVPTLDRERDSFNMREAKMAKTIIKLLALPPGNDRTVLNKSHMMTGQATDFGDVVYHIIRKYLSSYKEKLMIDDVNQFLDHLSKRNDESKAEALMMKVFEKTSAENIRWIIRIILKDLKLGISANDILNCYHKDAAAFYASNNNLRKVCEVLADKSVKLHELEIQIFEPFRPMLSKKIDANNFKKEFTENKLYYVENKFDGERFQLHLMDGDFKFFSRNGFNFTDNLGKNYNTGLFTPKLKGLLNPHVKKVILDGEMMLWNKRERSYGSKGLTWDVKKLTVSSLYQPCFCVYDIILLNDKILTNNSLKVRKKLLETIFKNKPDGVIELSKVEEVTTRQEIVDKLNIAVDRQDEGIIVKDPESIYKYSDRNSGWYKMKLEYFQDVMNDLDLIMMGGIYATSTSDILNSFIVGVRSGYAENGRPLYQSLGKVTSGLNTEEITMLDKKLKSEGQKFAQFSCKELNFGKEKPDYYIEPQKSLVFQIRATELIRTNNNAFQTPYTLRFPRILKIREDKPPDECLDINELLELTKTNKSVIKLNKKNITLEEIIRTKTRKVKHKTILMPTIHDTTQALDILEGFNIFVLNGCEGFDKETAEAFIKKAGGTVLYRETNKIDIILAGKSSDKLKQLVRSRKKYDIININWLKRVIKDGNLLGYNQEEVYYIGYNHKNCLSDELDMYGDSYTEPTSVDKLKRTFEIIQEMGVCSNQNGSVELVGTRQNFSQYTVYFDKYAELDNQDSDIVYDSFLDEIEFQFYSGNICDSIAKANLVLYNGDESRRRLLEDYIFSKDMDNVTVKPNTFIYQYN